MITGSLTDTARGGANHSYWNRQLQEEGYTLLLIRDFYFIV